MSVDEHGEIERDENPRYGPGNPDYDRDVAREREREDDGPDEPRTPAEIGERPLEPSDPE